MSDFDDSVRAETEKTLSLDELRSRLSGIGYLESPVERLFCMVGRRGRLGGLVVTALFSGLTGLVLAGYITVGNLVAGTAMSAAPGDMLMLMAYLAGTYSLVLFSLLALPALLWSARSRTFSGRLKLGSPLRATLLSTAAAVVMCVYLMSWWHSALRSSQNLLPFSVLSGAMMVAAALVSMITGRLLSFIYLLTAGVARQPARRGNHVVKTYGYAFAVVVLIIASWTVGVFRHHSADHTLAQALEVYHKPPLPVLLVGLDGLDLPTIETLSAQDSLPNLTRLIREGFSAPLHSRSEYLAPQVWTTVATGVKPEMHGIEGFTRPAPWGMSRVGRIVSGRPGLNELFEYMLPFAGMIRRVPVNTASRMTRTLWEINELFGNSAGVVNWWATWPADVSDGFTISERTFPKIAYFHRQQAINPSNYYQREVFPAAEFDSLVDFRQRLAGPFEETIRNFPRLTGFADSSESGQVAALVRSVSFADYFYCMAALEIASRRQVGFLAIYIQGADVLARLEERVDNVRQADIPPLVREYYRYADYLLGLLLERYQPNGLAAVICEPGKEGRRSGTRGLVLFHGMDTGSGSGSSEPVMLEDIAPTILFLSGLPVSRNMSGRTVVEAGARGPGGARPPHYVTSFGPPPLKLDLSSRYSHDREMIQRQRSLDYVK
ncbi:MAG: hypothetical protein FVQ81_15545 [Candidatus Glassbacteria bacterium]|nr:hypothetical protein [Candidatus Glassbacteria bacterium]